MDRHIGQTLVAFQKHLLVGLLSLGLVSLSLVSASARAMCADEIQSSTRRQVASDQQLIERMLSQWKDTYRSKDKFQGVHGFVYVYPQPAEQRVFFQIFNGQVLMDMPVRFESLVAAYRSSPSLGTEMNLHFPYSEEGRKIDEFVLIVDALSLDILGYEYEDYTNSRVPRVQFRF